MNEGRIKVIYLDHSDDFSGGQKSLLALLSLIDRNRIEPLVLIDKKAVRMESELQKINIAYQRINNFNIKYLEYLMVPLVIANILILIKRHRGQLLHCNTFKSGLVGSIIRSISSIPVIFRARLGIIHLSHGFLDAIIFKRVNLILANSHYVKHTFEQRFGKSDKIKVVYNPLHFNYKLNVDAVQELKQTHFNSPEIFSFGLIGRIEPFKKLHYAVEAVRLLSLKQQKFKVLFIGANPKSSGDEYATYIHSLIHRYHLSDYFVFTGFVSEILEMTSLLDCVLLCSEGEALSRGVYESQSLGIPVITSDSGGNPELIEDGSTGLLFEPGNAESLAAKMEKIMMQEYLREKIINQAKKNCLIQFSHEATVELEMKTYEILISEQPS